MQYKRLTSVQINGYIFGHKSRIKSAHVLSTFDESRWTAVHTVVQRGRLRDMLDTVRCISYAKMIHLRMKNGYSMNTLEIIV